MKTVFAQGRKDLVSNAVLLWVWGICIGVDCVCSIIRFPFHPGSLREAGAAIIGTIVGGMTIAIAAFATQALLATVLLVRIVQADLLTDSSAFWRTRPIARHQLLAEKALFAALFLAGGFLAGWAIHFGSSPSAGGTAGLGVLVFVSGLVAFAAVTSDLSKLLLALLALAWGAMIVAAITLALLRGLAASAGVAATFWPLGYGPLFNGERGHLIVSAFYLLAFVAITVCQYLTLRTRLSRALLFATFFVAALLQGSSRVQFHATVTHTSSP